MYLLENPTKNTERFPNALWNPNGTVTPLLKVILPSDRPSRAITGQCHVMACPSCPRPLSFLCVEAVARAVQGGPGPGARLPAPAAAPGRRPGPAAQRQPAGPARGARGRGVGRDPRGDPLQGGGRGQQQHTVSTRFVFLVEPCGHPLLLTTPSDFVKFVNGREVWFGL